MSIECISVSKSLYRLSTSSNTGDFSVRSRNVLKFKNSKNISGYRPILNKENTSSQNLMTIITTTSEVTSHCIRA